jgi:hypothetical protein
MKGETMEMAREIVIQKTYVHFGMRSPRLFSNPEEYVIKKDLREKMAEELSDEAVDLGYELMEEPENIFQFFREGGEKIGYKGKMFRGKIPIEQKGLSRKMLMIYLRNGKGMTVPEAKEVVAELFCWMYAVVYS